MRRIAICCVATFAALVSGCLENGPTTPVSLTNDSLTAEADQLEADALQTVNDLKRIAAQLDGGVAELVKQANVVHLPPGVDALAAAIAQAGNHGVVILESGLHQESGTVVVDQTVQILGEPGSILEVDTHPLPADTSPVDAALHILGAPRVVIWGVTLRPVGPIGGTGILIEDSPRVTVAFSTLEDHQYSIVVEQGDRVMIVGNTLHCSTAWQVGTIAESHGVIIINAERATIAGNNVSGGLFGLWPCDKRGVLIDNTVSACFLGIILCRVPMAVVLPGGEVVGAEFSATKWVTKFNHVSDCFDANYMVIDGANNNLVAFNESVNPGTYDIELVGDSLRFGFLTPSSFENTVIVGNDDLVVKDCGSNNTVIGGALVDNTADPCF